MANQVTLTFAGEEKPLTDSFDRVGASSKKMSDEVGSSSEGFRRAGEAADEVDTKAMGFRDTLTGVQDSLKGVSMLASGPSFEGFLTLGAGIGDLGSGFYNFLIPALEKTKIATLASAAASKAAAVGARIWAAAQWLMNASMWASPLTWIIAAVIALVVVIVLIAKKTDWFSKAWKASWAWIKQAAANTWEWLKKLPGWIGSAFSKIAGAISWPYRKAFNLIADAWNATIGRLSWTVPGWVPFIGGNTISVPNLPHFHSGGVVPGVPGTPTVAVLQAGEEIGSIASSGGGDSAGWVPIRGDAVIDSLVQAIASRVSAKGGRGAQLGIRVV